MSISKSRIKDSIDSSRVKTKVRNDITDTLEPFIKEAVAAKLDISVSDLKSSDFDNDLDGAVNSVMGTMNYVIDALIDELKIVIDALVDEIKDNAEISYSVAVPAENVGEATVLPGTFSQGAGAAAVPNAVPVKIKINKINVPKGGVK